MSHLFYQPNKKFLLPFLFLVILGSFFALDSVEAKSITCFNSTGHVPCSDVTATYAQADTAVDVSPPPEGASYTGGVCILAVGGAASSCDVRDISTASGFATFIVTCQDPVCNRANGWISGPSGVPMSVVLTTDDVSQSTPPVDSPTVDITCNNTQGPCSITSGSSVSIGWIVSNATACNIDGVSVDPNGGVSGSNPTATRTYTLTCSNSGGSSSDTVTVNVTSGGSCVPNVNNSCTSATNSCGMTNSGTIQCDGSCSASTPSNNLCGPSCVPNVNNSCTSATNSCGMTNSGTIQCDGSCSAATPSNGLCTPSSFTDDATASFSTPIPSSLAPGQVVNFIVHVSDSGNTKWYNGSAYQLIQKSALAIAPSYGHLPFVMNPGDSNDWSFNLTAPTTPGSYTFNMQMLHYGGWNYVKPDGSSSTGPSSDTYFGQIVSKTFTVASGSSCVPNQGSSCTSSANSCGMTNSGTIQCDGSCSAAAPPDNSCVVQGPPAVSNVTISSPTVHADGSTFYNIVITSADPTAGGNIFEQYVLINEGGTNTGQYRGYLGWYNGNVWTGIKDYQACLGGGYAGIHGYEQYIELDSCSTSVSGAMRTNIFTVRFNPAFTTPVTNNDISGLTGNSFGRNIVAPGNATYWTNFDINFGLYQASSVPVVDSVTINAPLVNGVPQVNTTNGAQYNIIIRSIESTGAANITDNRVFINWQGDNGGNYRGNLSWEMTNIPSYAGFKNHQACGGGWAEILPSYGENYIYLDSCSTSDSGNNRATTFTVHFDPSFTTPLTLNDISGWTRNSSGLYPDWINFDINFSLFVNNPMNYTLSNSGTSNVTKTSGNAFTQNTITKTLISGGTESVTLSVSGLPSGVSVDSISSQGCSPTCQSTITLRVSPSASVGTYPITVIGSPLNKQTTFNLIVSGNPTTVSCSGAPSTALLGQIVTWTANVSGGTPPFTYSWSGTNIPTNPAPNTNPFNISYSTIGQKSASVTVTDSDSVPATCVPAGTVQINFNPAFEEF